MDSRNTAKAVDNSTRSMWQGSFAARFAWSGLIVAADGCQGHRSSKRWTPTSFPPPLCLLRFWQRPQRQAAAPAVGCRAIAPGSARARASFLLQPLGDRAPDDAADDRRQPEHPELADRLPAGEHGRGG